MKALLVDTAGERPVMVPGEHPDPVPGKRELLVAVKATAVNRADLAQKAGKYPPPEGASPLLGLEMSGVGTAAIQLAKQRLKCTVAVTVGSMEKANLCRKMGADLAVNYKQEDFREAIARAWGPAVIDLIIDPVGAPYWERNIDLLGMDGRLVYLAFMGGSRVDEV